ncbi:MAG: DUF4349 domain-containing protein [Dehalococcoidales bacterium]|nr:DUF4349 domain-containing protein [Dehalococcoidales bacterium]
MKKLTIVGLIMIAILLASVSCAGAAKPRTSSVPMPTTSASASAPGYHDESRGPMPPVTTTAPAYGGAVPSPGSTPVYQSPASVDRMVIRTGNMELVVSEVASALDSIGSLAVESGGYVVNSQKWKEGERNIGTISIRVLAENYDAVVAAIRGLAKSVTSESTSSQDVTEEYVDLDSKVRNLEASEIQLLKIMETAAETDDIIKIQRELTNVRDQIEQAKGRMQFLQRTSSTSLIQVRLNEAMLDLKFSADKVRVATDENIRFTTEVAGGFAPYNYQWYFGDGETSVESSPSHSYKKAGTYTVSLKVTDDKGYTNSISRNEYISIIESWNPGKTAQNAWEGFTSFGRGLVNALIVLGVFSPVWIVIGAIVGLVIYKKRKKP